MTRATVATVVARSVRAAACA